LDKLDGAKEIETLSLDSLRVILAPKGLRWYNQRQKRRCRGISEQDKIQLFENKRIRTAWDEEREERHFSIVDVVAVLTDQPTQRGASTYWAVLKKRLTEEDANELFTNCKQLKMTATDGKKRATDVADTEQLLRIIQSPRRSRSRCGWPLWAGSALRRQSTRN